MRVIQKYRLSFLAGVVLLGWMQAGCGGKYQVAGPVHEQRDNPSDGIENEPLQASVPRFYKKQVADHDREPPDRKRCWVTTNPWGGTMWKYCGVESTTHLVGLPEKKKPDKEPLHPL
jgi:hypothetical protein